jgi:molybdopterin/thiamine biosynthesis adenylyltransferase
VLALMEDDKLLQYSRQIMLPEIDISGQQALLASRVLIIGLGGLGSPAAMYLAAAGVGNMVLVDDDKVELSNLQRQIIHQISALGLPKTDSAAATLQQLNPDCKLELIGHRLHKQELAEQVKRADVVLDCTDNFATRFAINRTCVAHQTPLVSGAAIRWEGQVAVFNGQPCYHCLYGESGEPEDTCSTNGVLAPVVGIIGSIQAVEAIKVLTSAGIPLTGRLLLMDALRMEWRSVKLNPDPNCPVCAHG